MLRPSTNISRRDFHRLALNSAAAGGAAMFTSCARPVSVKPDPAQAIVLVTIDTARTDRFGCYGYMDETTPFLTWLAQCGARFDNVTATTPNTAPAHTTIFSGLQMIQHGVFSNMQHLVPPGVHLITETLKDANFQTGAFTSVRFLKLLEAGFDVFSESERGHFRHYRPANSTVDAALQWLQEINPQEKLFLWLHLFDPHQPLRPPTEYVDQFRWKKFEDLFYKLNYWVNVQKINPRTGELRAEELAGNIRTLADVMCRYDAELRFVDTELARLYHQLKHIIPPEKQRWIVTADHGEGLGTHGWYGHTKYLYQEAIRIPLIIARPNRRGGAEIAEPVEQGDIAPTIAQLAGVPLDQPNYRLMGRSLLPYINKNGSTEGRVLAYAERVPKHPKMVSSTKWVDDLVYSVQVGPYKYLHHSDSENELFDLSKDPYEQENIAALDPARTSEVAEKARRRFEQLREDNAAEPPAVEGSLNDEELEALGYLN